MWQTHEEIENYDEHIDNLICAIPILLSATDNTYHTQTAIPILLSATDNTYHTKFAIPILCSATDNTYHTKTAIPILLSATDNTYHTKFAIPILCSATDNTYHTKTAKFLEQAIGANILIAAFYSKRFKFLIPVYIYRNIVAHLEVVILCKYHELKCKMRDIENETLLNTIISLMCKVFRVCVCTCACVRVCVCVCAFLIVSWIIYFSSSNFVMFLRVQFKYGMWPPGCLPLIITC